MLTPLLKKMERAAIRWINVDRYLPLQIDITNACNLRCAHCYHPHHRNEGAIELADWIAVIDQYERLITRLGFRPLVIICGGEPFLSRHLAPILENLLQRKLKYELSILTNGTMVEEKILERLRQFEKVSVQVSLDGACAPDHDTIRGKGNFDKALTGIRKLQSSGIPVNISTVLSLESSRKILEFFDLAKSLKVDGIGFARLIVQGQAKGMVAEERNRPLGPLELRDAYRKMVEESARTRVKTNFHSPLFHLVHPGLGRNGRFWEGIVVDYKGNYLASSRSRLVLGHALKDGIENIFLNHPLLKRLRQQDVKVCGACPHYAICGGDRNAAFAFSGDFLGPDPGCWLNINDQTRSKIYA